MNDSSEKMKHPPQPQERPTYLTLSFRTDREWTSRDLSALLDSATTLYNIFLACVVRTRLEDRYVRYTLDNLKRYEYFYKEFLVHPALIERLRLQQEICQVWQRERIPNFDSLSSFLSLPFPQQVKKESIPPMFPEEIHMENLPPVKEIYDFLSFYITTDEELRVSRLEIPSPGIVCLEGVDGVVQQMRSLIREVCRHERDHVPQSRQEVIERYIQTNLKLRDVGMPPLPRYVKLSSRMNDHIEALLAMQSTGKLRTLDVYLDFPAGSPDEAPGVPAEEEPPPDPE